MDTSRETTGWLWVLLVAALALANFAGILLFHAEAAGAAPVVEIGEAVTVERDSVPCSEGEACWDAWLMGNRTVGVSFFDWSTARCARIFDVPACLVQSSRGELSIVAFRSFDPFDAAAMRFSDGAVVSVVWS